MNSVKTSPQDNLRTTLAHRAGADESDVGRRAVEKATKHILPLVMVCFFISLIDRTNIGIAALQMNKDLGMSASMFGFGAGLFFLMYCSMEIPSNVLMLRFGVRRWVARIMISWGLVAAGMAFVKGPNSFYIMRALLGLTEAGFFPAICFYLAQWFPLSHRGRIFSYLQVTGPLSFVVGAPISTALLHFDGLFGMRGWQWVFIVEAIPAVVMAFVVLAKLPDGPHNARWLAADERDWLADRLVNENREHQRERPASLFSAIVSPRVLLLGFVLFTIYLTIYGVGFFLPQIVKASNVSDVAAGLISTLPFAAGCIGMLWFGRSSDATKERRLHTVGPLVLAAAALFSATMTHSLPLQILAFSVAAVGAYGCIPAFWTLPTIFFSGAAMAIALATINTVGGIGGFAGPWMMGVVRDSTGSFSNALLVVGILDVLAAAIIAFMPLAKERS